jgi:hypothetical protein
MMEPERPQMTITYGFFACWVNKATRASRRQRARITTHEREQTRTEIRNARQQWFRENALFLSPYVHCLIC